MGVGAFGWAAWRPMCQSSRCGLTPSWCLFGTSSVRGALGLEIRLAESWIPKISDRATAECRGTSDFPDGRKAPQNTWNDTSYLPVRGFNPTPVHPAPSRPPCVGALGRPQKNAVQVILTAAPLFVRMSQSFCAITDIFADTSARRATPTRQRAHNPALLPVPIRVEIGAL